MMFPSSDHARAGMLRTALETSESLTRKATNCTRFAAKEVEEAMLLAWQPVFDRVPQLADTLIFMVESLYQLEISLRKVAETAREVEDLARPELLRIMTTGDPAREEEEPAQVAQKPDALSSDAAFEEAWLRGDKRHSAWRPDQFGYLTPDEQLADPENPADSVDPA